MLVGPMIRNFRLSPGRVNCNREGLRIGAINVVARGADGHWGVRDETDLSRELSVVYGFPIDISSRKTGLATVASALLKGDLAKAQIAALLLEFPDPPTELGDDQSARKYLADSLAASGLLNAGVLSAKNGAGVSHFDAEGKSSEFAALSNVFDPQQPRDEYGRWTSEGGSDDLGLEDGSEGFTEAAYQGEFHDSLAQSEIGEYRKTGATCLSEVRLSLGANTARIDILCKTKVGGLLGVEVKTGGDPSLTPDQIIVYSHSLLGGLSSPDGKISSLGFSPDEILPPFPILFVYAKEPGAPKQFFGPYKR